MQHIHTHTKGVKSVLAKHGGEFAIQQTNNCIHTVNHTINLLLGDRTIENIAWRLVALVLPPPPLVKAI